MTARHYNVAPFEKMSFMSRPVTSAKLTPKWKSPVMRMGAAGCVKIVTIQEVPTFHQKTADDAVSRFHLSDLMADTMTA